MVKNFFLLKNFKNIFSKNTDKKKILKILKEVLNENSQIIKSLGKTYQNSYKKKQLGKYKKSSNFRVIGMGGSALGTQAIYDFLKHKIKKKFIFINDLQKKQKKETKKGFTNLVVSKSGNTIETIVNSNILIKRGDKNIFITENKKNYLRILAERLKAEIVDHNNFIGGRYSVLSEVGMLPTELMGLNTNNFKQLNVLIKNKKFFDSLVNNVASIFFLIKKKKYNSVVINYDEKSESLFNWYQQLIAESLGKKGKGIIPLISVGPRDHHSLLQLYLDGPKDNFFYIFSFKESKKIKRIKGLFNEALNRNNIQKVLENQKKAMISLLKIKKIPFLSVEIKKRNEETLGELFSYFIIETIILAIILSL